jgi:hypothetical protein
MTRHRTLFLALVAAVAALAAGCGGAAEPDAMAADSTAADSIPADQRPRFTASGELVKPEGWEGWVLAGTSMGLGYTEPSVARGPDEPGIFLNVYIQPWAYEAFLETGEYPEGTMFVLAMAEPVRKADPARTGVYMGPISIMEVHLKQAGLHESGWGFYGFGSDPSAALIAGEANCYSCHRDEGGHDNTFVQFYPKFRERLGLVTAADSLGGME